VPGLSHCLIRRAVLPRLVPLRLVKGADRRYL
jgi:hypothetical protein